MHIRVLQQRTRMRVDILGSLIGSATFLRNSRDTAFPADITHLLKGRLFSTGQFTWAIKSYNPETFISWFLNPCKTAGWNLLTFRVTICIYIILTSKRFLFHAKPANPGSNVGILVSRSVHCGLNWHLKPGCTKSFRLDLTNGWRNYVDVCHLVHTASAANLTLMQIQSFAGSIEDSDNDMVLDPPRRVVL